MRLTKLGTGVNMCSTRGHMLNVAREVTLKHVLCAVAGAAALFVSAPTFAQTTLTIATVNNGDMIRMQGLPNEFTATHQDNTV